MRLLENLTLLMNEKGINRTDLARAIGVAPSTINSWFSRNCENISLSSLIKLSRYFNLTMEELVNGSPCGHLYFNQDEYSSSELEILKKFADFLVDSRAK